MATLIGVDIGQKHKPSAICVVETEDREIEGRSSKHYLVRVLERLPPGTSYVQLGQRLNALLLGISRLGKSRPMMHLNATDLGWPVVTLIEDETDHECYILPVHFNHGAHSNEDGIGSLSILNLGKAFLVSRLQCLLQKHELHLPSTPDAKVLRQELMDYDISVPEDANERLGAFKVGTRDDLVTAVGLAVHSQPMPFSCILT